MPTEEEFTSENRTTPQDNAKLFSKIAGGISNLAGKFKQGQSTRSARRTERRSSRSSRRSSRRSSGLTGLQAVSQSFTSGGGQSSSQDPFAPFGPLYLIDDGGRKRNMRPFMTIPLIEKRLPGNKPQWPVRKSTKFSKVIQTENKALMPIVAAIRPGTQIQSAIVQDQKKKESNTTLIVASVGIPIALIGGFFGYRHFFGDKSADGSQNYIY